MFLSEFLIFVRLFAFFAFPWLCFYALSAFWCFLCLLCLVFFLRFLCFPVRVKSFRKKKFKTVLITSFILLLEFRCPLFLPVVSTPSSTVEKLKNLYVNVLVKDIEFS